MTAPTPTVTLRDRSSDRPPAAAAEPKIDVQALSFFYGSKRALEDITLRIQPNLVTAFNNRFLSTDIRQPISTLTVQVYTYAISPYEDWHRQAWSGALVLVMIVLTCSLLARVATARMEKLQRGS